MDYNWNFGLVFSNISFLLQGLRMTIIISLVSMVLASIIGLIAALMRLSRIAILERISILYVDFFRSVPAMVVLIWFYYCLPILTGIDLPAVLSAVVGLSLYMGSYMAEIYRGGIMSIEKGQREAAAALGMTGAQAMRRIILPQAVVRMLPPMGSSFISLVKESSLASVVAVAELMRRGHALTAFTFRSSEVFTVVAVLYFVVTYPLAIFVNSLHRRLLPEREG
jgi:polar amino acid transport system permease protein